VVILETYRLDGTHTSTLMKHKHIEHTHE